MFEIKTKYKTYKIFIQKNSLVNFDKYVDLSKFSKIAILTDENLIQAGWLNKLFIDKSNLIQIKSGEINKNLDTVSSVWKQMNDFGLDRKSLLINLGGGVVCDLGGFCASTYMRGIEFIQVPTTLLSQVDASVGGKTGFDFNGGKNTIGTFTEPYAVVIDSNTLTTLPIREYNSGMAEVIKYGIIYDKEFFEYLSNTKDIDNDYIIHKSCEIKANVVQNDFKESGVRKILNFGHTIGHAVESLSLKTKSPLLHGEAVAIGMIAICNIAEQFGKITTQENNRIKQTLIAYNLPIKYNGNLEEIYTMLFKDKKTVGKKIKWVLPNGIGKYEFDVELNERIIKDGISSIVE